MPRGPKGRVTGQPQEPVEAGESPPPVRWQQGAILKLRGLKAGNMNGKDLGLQKAAKMNGGGQRTPKARKVIG